MRYSKWYSNQDKKLVLLIVIKEIKDQFKLPRPTNSKHQQNPPSADFVVFGVQKPSRQAFGTFLQHVAPSMNWHNPLHHANFSTSLLISDRL